MTRPPAINRTARDKIVRRCRVRRAVSGAEGGGGVDTGAEESIDPQVERVEAGTRFELEYAAGGNAFKARLIRRARSRPYHGARFSRAFEYVPRAP